MNPLPPETESPEAPAPAKASALVSVQEGMKVLEARLEKHRNRFIIWGSVLFILFALIALIVGLSQESGGDEPRVAPEQALPSSVRDRNGFEEDWARSHDKRRLPRRP